MALYLNLYLDKHMNLSLGTLPQAVCLSSPEQRLNGIFQLLILDSLKKAILLNYCPYSKARVKDPGIQVYLAHGSIVAYDPFPP
jgi:hypothetical protein